MLPAPSTAAVLTAASLLLAAPLAAASPQGQGCGNSVGNVPLPELGTGTYRASRAGSTPAA